MPHRLLELARFVDPHAARDAEARFAGDPRFTPDRFAAAVLAATAYPAAASRLHNEPASLDVCLPDRLESRLDRDAYLRELRSDWPLASEDEASISLRRFARAHRLRIALREVLPVVRGDSRFEATSAEISDLASATIQIAFERALLDMRARYGAPVRSDGAPSSFAVLGMGKLGGRELNAGSDVDLIFVYDTDDGEVRRPGEEPGALHEFWLRVARRLVTLLDDVTDEGFVWRVDLRLRPEGTRGALVNSVAATLRYYEAWGRQWERAVLLRACPVAGDLELGAFLLQELEPFVFRRRVDPTLADTMIDLARRSRVELSKGGARDLKLGEGGIREVELFVQALQLIWGGVHEGIRVKPTLEALRRLLARGLVTEREAELMDAAYVLLRRAEHVVQHATGLQTHLLPDDDAELARVARTLGYVDAPSFDADLGALRERVHTSFTSLSTTQVAPVSRFTRLLSALDAQEPVEVLGFLRDVVPSPYATPELARDLGTLAQRPDSLLGAITRERHPGHAECMLEGILDSADPEMAARHLRVFFAHPSHRTLHASIFAENPQAALRFVTALGASAFVGELLGRHPELGDQVLFSPGMPSEDAARAVLHRELERMAAPERLDLELVAGAIRRAKMRVVLEVALADLADEVGVQQTTAVLSSMADTAIERALRAASQSEQPVRGLCVLAVGKLGGCELGYASDLDVLFVYEPSEGDDGRDAARFARVAQKTIRVLSGVHEDGPGYELDTRLRPSGSQGVLVTSLSAFARYHGLASDGPQGPSSRKGAASWERQTLTRARACAGDAALADRVMQVVHRAAYESGAPDVGEIHRLRLRLERELGRERAGRHDLKLGPGGLLDVEFAAQVMQMRHGADRRVRETGTLAAIDALESAGVMAVADARVLREGYVFLRRLEQRLHVVHATSIHLVEADAPGLVPLARRMGFRAEPGLPAEEQLLSQVREVKRAVRETYLRMLGVGA